MAQPPFCSSAPMLTWTKQGACHPALSIALASAVTRGTIERVDAVEQGHRLIRLVGLELADKVEFDFRAALAQRRPLGGHFLHPVFAEHALAGFDQRQDRGRLVGLADRDQRHFLALPLRDPRGLGDAGADLGECYGWIGHGALL